MAEDLSKLSHSELVARATWYENKYGPYIHSRGMNNWKNLFRKPNSYEWTILFMLVMTLFGAYAYFLDTKQCTDTLNNLPAVCNNLALTNGNNTTDPSYMTRKVNFSGFNWTSSGDFTVTNYTSSEG